MPLSDNNVRRIREQMQMDHAPELIINAFLNNTCRWRQGDLGAIPGNTLTEIGRLPHLDELDEMDPISENAIARTVIMKLNGGLGTSMGLERAKSLITAKNGLSFLDIIVRQVEFLRRKCRAPLPLLLMNSFSTNADSLDALSSRHPSFHNPAPFPLSFCQHRVPKLEEESGAPIRWQENPALEWCPPGHADIYYALQTTGLLDHLLAEGYRYAFVSNADNLGALLHMGILGHLARNRLPFLMEVTARTECDRKGGHLARDRKTGRLLLRESAQCPPDEITDFQNIHTYALFNTNNIWFNLESLRDLLHLHRGLLDIPLIVNRKAVHPARQNTPRVVQLEAAMGAAISCFEQAAALVVPRHRFAPVKTTNDLLAIRSDLYTLGEEHQVALHPLRFTPPPDIQLDPLHYRNLTDFEAHFPLGAPSLLHCDSLQINGNIFFGRHVRIDGHVHLRNPTSIAARIPDNTHLHTPVET
ncbi:MAG: UTP--glucose-1-phosphate uridylyltransferase [Verrucomicrobiota bacterium]|jgi:UTP--glucose-1-phosphate uridylyltransferase|nr:UTP--glucose-1-phosphate uridylyltransferase [Verrucomicrobiota bacterium]